MAKIIIIYLLSILIFSCSQINEKFNIEDTTSKIEVNRIINDKLLAFKTVYIAELGEFFFF